MGNNKAEIILDTFDINIIEEILKKDEEIYTKNSFKICDYCGHEIFGQQKYVSKGGKIYHVKPCWRTLQKKAKKEAFG